MSLRYLFGPVAPEWADANLHRERAAGACLTFNDTPGTDLTVGPADTWESICARLPDGWRPDFVVLHLPYRTVPAFLWSAPVPLVAFAPDWQLQWHATRRRLRAVERILTDQPGVEVLAREGIDHARPANLFACPESFQAGPWPDAERDIDVLFVGNLHPAVQRERLAWLGRLARLADRWRVTICEGVFGDDYRRLLGRARIVFNRSVRGECNRRAFEAAAAGALLFQEADNRETAQFFRDRQECVCYTADDLEALLDHYLTHEDDRRPIAEAARARVRQYAFEDLWRQQMESVENDWPELQERAGRRPALTPEDALLCRTWEAASSCDAGDPTLAGDLATRLRKGPANAALHNALGLAITRASQGGGPVTAEEAALVLEDWRRVLALDPGHVVAGLNLAEALTGMGRYPDAVRAARQALAALERQPALGRDVLEAGHFPPGFDLFRVEWERAAWANAGRPHNEGEAKRALLRCRLHGLLGQLTGELSHYQEAALARSDLGIGRAALGCALARAGRFAEALPHLKKALADNPFDLQAARALFEVLGHAGEQEDRLRLARDRRLLSQAAPKAVPPERWFQEARPVGDELASIIVPCFNQLEYTRQCLESVLRHTRPPYEVVLIDNGSEDGTAAYFEEVRSWQGPERVAVVRNSENRGFPAAANQGLKEARGRYLVLLNNDTIVTPGWLDGLVAWSLHQWPRVGLVGPVTNASRPPQEVPTDYEATEGIDAFAARRRQQFAGQAREVERLTGFCLLLRREVLEQVGGLDERYGLGFFDDDDLCVRAQQAGFRLLLAQDVFVHHFGSRTFEALGIDCRQKLRDNFALFREKWGPQHAAGYRLPDAPTADAGCGAAVPAAGPQAGRPHHNPGRPRVSLCMIVKDEEENMPACLDPVKDLVDEIVVVDTGSSDRTKEVAARLGAQVHDFPWCDSFAAARNETLRHATGDWAFWLDADDRLDEENREKLRALFAGLDGANVAYAMKCLCLPDPVSKTATVVDHVRLFRNRPDVRWRYRVHEQILPAVRRSGGDVRWSDVVIHHVGYQDPAVRGSKLQRDLRLLLLEDGEQPDDPFTLFNLGSVYQELGRHAEALPALRRSLERSHPSDSIVRKLYALLVQCHRKLGQPEQALAACRAGRGFYPEDAELLFQEAELRRQSGDRAGAVQALRQLLEKPEGSHFASLDTGVTGYKARHNLAVLLQEQRQPAEAEAEWRAAVAEQPGFVPSWLGLAELYLAAGRWQAVEEVAAHLETKAEAPMEAGVLRARVYLGRKEFAEARAVLGDVIARFPQAVWPRVLLSHALLQEGQDWQAAEQALRDVLALDPEHAEARRNLAVLLRQHRAAS